MNWLLKNVGLVALGLCLIAAAASVESALNDFGKRLDGIEARQASDVTLNTTLSQIAAAIPAQQLR